MAYGQVNADVIGTSVTGSNLGAGNASIMKNRIINGAMVIDQRNAGASVTSTGNNYAVDRWNLQSSVTSKYTVQQNAGSVTPPAGFTKYLGATSSSAYSVGASDYFGINQLIEGFNIADLGWGTANAKPVTVSFIVYSSLTGTFSGSLINGTNTRSYAFTYSIPVANTWTNISVTIAGDTSGTWATDNGIGMKVWFNLGAGSTYSGTAGSWSSSLYLGATGATSVVGTNGATFYLTGVQLEVGSSATGYEYRQYGQELALCQRYYCKSYAQTVTPGTNVGSGAGGVTYGGSVNNQSMGAYAKHPQTLRAAPTVTTYDNTGNSGKVSYYNGGWQNNGTFSTNSANDNSLCIQLTVAAAVAISFDYTASAEL